MITECCVWPIRIKNPREPCTNDKHFVMKSNVYKQNTKTLTIELKPLSGIAQTSSYGLVCIPIMMPDPADSQCPVWSGDGNVVWRCRSSSGRPLSADCGGRIAPGESSSDASSLVRSSWSSLGEQPSAEPSTTTAESIRRSSEPFSTIPFCSVLYKCISLTSCVRALMVFWSSLANVRLWTTSSYFPTASCNITIHQGSWNKPHFPKCTTLKKKKKDERLPVGLDSVFPPFPASHCSFPVSAIKKINTFKKKKNTFWQVRGSFDALRVKQNQFHLTTIQLIPSCHICPNNIKAPSFSQCYGSCAWGRWGRPRCTSRSRSRWSRPG